jgi:hypothetical protein
LFVGIWIDHQEIYALAEAFEQVRLLAPGVQLTIAGCAQTEQRVRHYFSPAAPGSINIGHLFASGNAGTLCAA